MKNKYAILFLASSVMLSSICACEKSKENYGGEEDTLVIETDKTNETNEATGSTEEKENHLLPGPVTVDYTIRYYDVINDEMIEYSDSQFFEEAAEPEFFVNKLASLMQMRIDVNSIIVTDSKMVIDFSSDSAPLNGTGSYEESCILESIAELIFSVYDDVNYIYYTADGKDYESGHISISKDSPYAQR